MQQMGKIQGGATHISIGSSRPLDHRRQVTSDGESYQVFKYCGTEPKQVLENLR